MKITSTKIKLRIPQKHEDNLKKMKTTSKKLRQPQKN